MTTAHRPTWKAAVGKANEGGWSAGGSVSTALASKDVPGHTTLKFRHQADNKKKALERSLLELEEAEQKAKACVPKRRPVDEKVEKDAKQKLLKQTAEVDEVRLKEKYNDSDVDDGGGGASSGDEESDLDDDDSDDELDASSSSDEESDDEAALQAELAKIRAEREEAKRKQQQEEAAEENAKQEEAALLGNPLLSSASGTAFGGAKRRRWNEDAVFRNQAKGEPAQKKRFINDTVRNDFHKRFLNKFIR